MSLEDVWETVDAFRTNTTPTAEDIVELDLAMMQILRQLKSEVHCRDAGLSARFPRYQSSYPERGAQEELNILHEHYRARHRDLNRLERLIAKKKHKLERACSHEWERDWSSRDHHSSYICRICGALR